MSFEPATKKSACARETRSFGGADCDVVMGWNNKLRAAIAHIMPANVLAEQHRKMAEPGTASQR
jgi:hypothetical protein